MIIRKYIESDRKEIVELFYNTVHTVNIQDYTEEQYSAWTSKINLMKWNKSLMEHHCIVAIEEDQIIGFTDIDVHGFLDRLYVHKDRQRKKVATAFLHEL